MTAREEAFGALMRKCAISAGASDLGEFMAELSQEDLATLKEMLGDKEATLRAALRLAVPFWMGRLESLTWEERMKRRDECLVVLGVGRHDKDCMDGAACLAEGFPARRKGQVAEAFNRLAEGLAIGALQPGGVTFMGLHFEAGGVSR